MISIHVDGMTCNHCASTITNILAKLDQAATVQVDLPKKTVTVSGATLPPQQLADAIDQAGFTVGAISSDV